MTCVCQKQWQTLILWQEERAKKETEDNELKVVHSASKGRKKNNKVVEFDYVKNDSYSLSNQKELQQVA